MFLPSTMTSHGLCTLQLHGVGKNWLTNGFIVCVSYCNNKKCKNLHQMSYYIWKERIILEWLCSDFIRKWKYIEMKHFFFNKRWNIIFHCAFLRTNHCFFSHLFNSGNVSQVVFMLLMAFWPDFALIIRSDVVLTEMIKQTVHMWSLQATKSASGK